MTTSIDIDTRLNRLRHNGMYSILAIDHVEALASLMCPDDPARVSAGELTETKLAVVAAMAAHASGVLLDPQVGLLDGQARAALPADTGLVIGLEFGDYQVMTQTPQLLPEWSVERAAELGADAVKVSCYYEPLHPAPAAEQFVKAVASEAARLEIPLFAEPLALATNDVSRRDAVLDGVRRFGVFEPTVLKIEFPEDSSPGVSRDRWAEACTEVTTTSPVPWTLLSAGQNHTTFVELVKVATQCGSSGFLAGRTVWGDVVTGQQSMAVGATRLAELARATESGSRPQNSGDDAPR